MSSTNSVIIITLVNQTNSITHALATKAEFGPYRKERCSVCSRQVMYCSCRTGMSVPTVSSTDTVLFKIKEAIEACSRSVEIIIKDVSNNLMENIIVFRYENK